MRYKVICKNCGKEYFVIKARLKITKYCSRKCHNTVISHSPKKGTGTGYTSKKGMRPELIDRNKSDWMKQFIKGPNASNWKGDDIGYVQLHIWIRNNYGQPSTCEHCFKIEKNNRKIHWANKSGQYKRDREDWLRLCNKCHYLFDLQNKNIIKKFVKHKLNKNYKA
jgi:hypothetical protein